MDASRSNPPSDVAPASAPAGEVPCRAPGRWSLARNGYWLAGAAMVLAYLGWWLAHFPYVYGWHHDDHVYFVKAIHAAEDPRAAFTEYLNAHHAFFLGFSYLPARAGWSVPSHEIPSLGGRTGNYRFLILWTILYHGVVAAAWLWFARKLSGPGAAALISLLLLLVSQEFVLWTPQPETRFAGVPLMLGGMWWLALSLRQPVEQLGARCWRAALAGTLFYLGHSLNYTVLYLIVPWIIVHAVHDAFRHWRRGAGVAATWAALVLGALAWHGSLELLSHYYARLPWTEGPTAALVAQRNHHLSCFTFADSLRVWADFWNTSIGLPLTIAAGAGAYWFLRHHPAGARFPRDQRNLAVASVLLALGMILLQPTAPILRKSIPMQPFLFLFAAVAIVRLASAPRRPWARAVLGAALLGGVAAVPVSRAAEFFTAHTGLGRVLAWAENQRGPRALRWMFYRCPDLYGRQALLVDDPDNWVLAMMPVEIVARDAELAGAIERAAPLRVATTPWAVFWQRCVPFLLRRDGHASIRHARLYRAGDLSAALACPQPSPGQRTARAPGSRKPQEAPMTSASIPGDSISTHFPATTR